MRGRAHLTIGCATWIAANAAMSSPHLLPLTLGTIWAGSGALIPDIDMSRLGRRLFGGHRHLTHSLVGVVLAAVAAVVTTDLAYGPWWGPVGFITGYLTHIAADSMTVQGCPWLWPSPRKFWLLPQAARITTGGKRVTWGPYGHVVRAPAYGEHATALIVVLTAAACCYLRWR